VRFSKIHVVSVTLACLLLSGPAQGQFGKLKDLAKDKLGSKAKDNQDKATATAQDSAEHKGVAGEAKATYAPGVKKVSATPSVAVSRRGGGSPEANVSSSRGGGSPVKGGTSQVQGGSSQVVSIRVSGIDARQFDAVRGYGTCNKLSNFQILSATQLKLTMDLTAVKSNGSCTLYFRSGGETVFSSDVAYKAK